MSGKYFQECERGQWWRGRTQHLFFVFFSFKGCTIFEKWTLSILFDINPWLCTPYITCDTFAYDCWMQMLYGHLCSMFLFFWLLQLLHSFTETFVKGWQRLPWKVPTCSWGALTALPSQTKPTLFQETQWWNSHRSNWVFSILPKDTLTIRWTFCVVDNPLLLLTHSRQVNRLFSANKLNLKISSKGRP